MPAQILFIPRPWIGLAVVLLANGAALAYNLIREGERTVDRLVPPGWEFVEVVVTPVWIVIMAALVIAIWQLWQPGDAMLRIKAQWLGILLISIALYQPTFGLSPQTGLIGNIFNLILPITIGLIVYPASPVGLTTIGVMIIWVSVATVYLVKRMQLNGLI